MPGLDGIETIRRLREISAAHGHDIPPMILVTAHSQDNELLRVSSFIDGLLAKPVSARNLLAEIARCFGLCGVVRKRTGWRKTDDFQWSRFKGIDILLVEDVEINREVMSELLASVGLKARLATNGVEAFAEVACKTPDLVLMDCHMPIMDGYAATRQLRANPTLIKLPIIALTASAMADDKRRCLAAGMDGYVAKPVNLDVLYEQMIQCLPEFAAEQGAESKTAYANATPSSHGLPQFAGI
jgi:CheY-like chemotaxis protein